MTELDRRTLLKAGFLAGIAGLLAGGTRIAHASAPLAKGPKAPGHYPFKVGDIEGIVLSDGGLMLAPLSPVVVPAEGEAEAKKLLADAFLPTDGVLAPLNTVVLKVGKSNILIDAGCGLSQGETVGHQVHALAAAGLSPADITHVFITHAHPDHLFGFADAAGVSRFPNAELVISEPELNFWNNKANDIPQIQALFDTARVNFKAAGQRVRTVKPGAEIAPGIIAVPAFGHTPGHSQVRVQSGSESLLITADTANHPILFLRHPEWPFSYDLDPAAASATRRKTLEAAVADKTRILDYHFPFPGIGRVRSLGSNGFEFVPEPWVNA
jgi:glyoxylase-like metal-dependent hydrolase (beta-lactamase superfamily II)